MQEKQTLGDSKTKKPARALQDKEAAQRRLDSDIIDAAAEGNLEQVKNLFSMGASIDAKDQWENTPLMRACLYGHENVARFLLDNGANVNATSGSWTSLILAARDGFTDVVELLIDRGAEMESRTSWNYTALKCALEGEHIDTARLMMRKGARKVGIELPTAAKMGMYKIVKLVAEEGGDIDATDEKGLTALAYIIHRKDFAMAKFLLEHGASIDKADQYGKTPLIRAVEKGDIETISFILENGANPNLKKNTGKTALMIAAMDGNLEIVKLLVGKGASIETEGKSALIEAIDNRHDNVAKFLIMSGANVNAKDEYDVTALMHALANGDMAEDKFEILMLLIDRGARIDAQNSRREDIIDLTRNYASTIPLPSSAHSAGASIWLTDIKKNAIHLQKFLMIAGAFQHLICKGPLSELALNFADCSMQRK
jgi:serine/threonine-protein phosphatase 6 regulatory ankyrin repeat subunit B